MFQFGYRPIESNALNGVKRSGRMHTTKRRPGGRLHLPRSG